MSPWVLGARVTCPPEGALNRFWKTDSEATIRFRPFIRPPRKESPSPPMEVVIWTPLLMLTIAPPSATMVSPGSMWTMARA